MKETVAQITMASTVLGTIAGWIPLVLAIPAAVYYCILIYEKIKAMRSK